MVYEPGDASAIEALLTEGRTFNPPEELAAHANVRDAGIYETADADP
jgi:hypothetical protein